MKLPTAQKNVLMREVLFSSVERQKKSQRPLLLFRVSKTALIKKINYSECHTIDENNTWKAHLLIVSKQLVLPLVC